jgi:hypothetical protein
LLIIVRNAECECLKEAWLGAVDKRRAFVDEIPIDLG